MCKPGKDNDLHSELLHAKSALMQPYAPIEGKEGEMFMPDKDENVAHAYEHLAMAEKMVWDMMHGKE